MRKLYFFLILLLPSFLQTSQAQQSYNMQFHSNWDDNSLPNRSGIFYNDIWGYAADGREYAILGSVVGTIFLDVTNPSSPQEVSRINGGYSPSLWRDFKTYRHFAYGVADETSSSNPSTLQIFDLSYLPDSVSKVYDSDAFFQKAHNIFIDTVSGRLYAVGTDTRRNGVIILDLSVNPAAPTVLASINLPGGYVHDVYVRDDTAYCSHGNNGLYIYDLRFPGSSNATNPIGFLTSYANSGYNHSSWLTDDGDHLIFADETHNRHLKVLDVSDLGNPTIVGTIKSTMLAPTASNSIAHNPFIKGDSVYISYYHEGVQVYDISNPNAPVNVSYYDTEPSNTNYNGYRGTWGVYPYLPSGNIIASDVARGLFVLETTTPVFALGSVGLQAEILPHGVNLNWQDDLYSAFVGFEIERAAPGEAFTTILETPMQEAGMAYQLLDKLPLLGENRYRLVGIDDGGFRHLSDEVRVNFSFPAKRLSVYPNPTDEQQGIHLLFGQNQAGISHIQLLSPEGKVYLAKKIYVEAGSSLHKLELPQLPTGIYFLRVQDETVQHVERITVR
jgi:choice-of-anchor B domain-containing protein